MRLLLFPFSLLYGALTALRNWLFRKKVLPSTRFDIPTLVIGNLNTGGTGKTPHTEYFLRLFSDRKCGVISRGYGRKSEGFLWVETTGEASAAGDEPLQMKRKFPGVPVAVCGDRVLAVPEFLSEQPETDLLLFDDAFQHRYLDANTYVLLTAFDDLFCDDILLPAGNLREARRGARRAHAVIVTKCPPGIGPQERVEVQRKIQAYSTAPIYFSFFERDSPLRLDGSPVEPERREDWKSCSVFLFSAIAHGATWADPYLKDFAGKSGQLLYPDHHAFTARDIALLRKKWEQAGKPVVLSTEKDAMRLQVFQKELQDMELVYFPIRVKLVDGETSLKELLDKCLFVL